jgi:hypothetical protein
VAVAAASAGALSGGAGEDPLDWHAAATAVELARIAARISTRMVSYPFSR